MKENHTLQKVNSGFVSIEVMGTLLIIMLAVLFGAEKLSEYLDDQEYTVMARHANSFNEAAKNYIADHTDTISNSATATTPVLITPDILKTNGYLQPGFFNNNSYGQSYVTAVVKNAKMNNTLQALTCTTGGSQIPYKGMRSISTHISGMGGYVNQDNVATGAYGGWQSNTTDFGINCTTGHVAIALSSEVLGTVNQESDRLYRYQVNGRPDLNKMHTSIDLGSNNLNNVATINGQTGSFGGNVNAANVTASSNVSANGNVTAGNGITANSDIRTNSGWLIAKHGKGWLNEDHGGGMYMDDNDWLKSLNGKGIYTSGELKGGRVTSEGRLIAGEYIQLNGLAVAGNGCSPDGLLGRNSSGGILSCQSGIWRDVGKNSGNYINLGSYTQQYNGRNDGDTTLQISVSGGASTRAKSVKEGSCVNTWALDAIVNGFTVVTARDNNVSWAKSGFITFAVPAKTNYTIISDPNPTEGCSPGAFSVVGYQ